MEVKRSRKGLPSRNRPNELLRYQQHAYVHARHGTCTDLELIEDAGCVCPICTTIRPIDDVSEDHAPQKSQDSERLGRAHVVVLTCKDCNSRDAGSTYEAVAAQFQRGELLTRGIHSCEVHGQIADRFVEAIPYSPREAIDRSDLKSAFLIAFATLGYRWALHPLLDPVRKAIRSKQQLAPQYGSVGVLNGPKRPERQVVLQLGRQPCTYIVGLENKAIKLPLFRPADLRKSLEAPLSVYRYDWPFLSDTHTLVSKMFNDGRCFALDQPDLARSFRSEFLRAA